AQESGSSPWSLAAGAGFSAGPGSFLLAAELPYALGEHLSLGPLLQLGLQVRVIANQRIDVDRFAGIMPDDVLTQNPGQQRLPALAEFLAHRFYLPPNLDHAYAVAVCPAGPSPRPIR
ncbi:MAG: hypothetical protein ACE5EX_09670, partial [Phycisphaerae bacterium]